MKLTYAEDFVIEQFRVATTNNYYKAEVEQHKATVMDRCLSHAQLIKRDLELWMVCPCDEDGNVISDPEKDDTYLWDVLVDKLKADGHSMGTESDSDILIEYAKKLHLKQYKQAKDRVLFKVKDVILEDGIIFVDGHNWEVFKTEYRIVKDLVELDVELTKAGEKEIGL